MINAMLNTKLHESRYFFDQYRRLVHDVDRQIPQQFAEEATTAQIAYLMFSLDSVIQLISKYVSDKESQCLLKKNVERIQHLLSETDSSNPKQCIEQLEAVSEVWSNLCY